MTLAGSTAFSRQSKVQHNFCFICHIARIREIGVRSYQSIYLSCHAKKSSLRLSRLFPSFLIPCTLKPNHRKRRMDRSIPQRSSSTCSHKRWNAKRIRKKRKKKSLYTKKAGETNHNRARRYHRRHHGSSFLHGSFSPFDKNSINPFNPVSFCGRPVHGNQS